MFRAILHICVLVVLLVQSCIKDDIPYPYEELYITGVEGEGFTLRRIDNVERTVYITLDEATDIQAVNITDVTCTEGAKLTDELVGVFDMRLPITSTLYLYQSFEWNIVAEQEITYSFKITGQIGSETIDADALTVEVNANINSVDITSIEVSEMKLGAADVTTYDPTIEALSGTSFASIRYVEVWTHGRKNTWKIRINLVEPNVELTVDAWGTMAWLNATGDTDDSSLCYFTYRRADSPVEIEVTPTSCTGGVFSACVIGLNPETEYLFKAYAASSESAEESRTTESTPLLPNGGFEEWHSSTKSVLYPYIVDSSATDDNEWWATGNEGSIIGGVNITTYDESDMPDSTEGTRSAKLSSKYVIAKFAAGNIFTGHYVSTTGTNGTINFGRPFTNRPVGLGGFAKYQCGKVTSVDSRVPLTTDDYDQGVIYVALGTWSAEEYGGSDTSPVMVFTADESTFFNVDSPDIVAYGEKYFTTDQDWEEFRIDLTYRDSEGTTDTAHSRIPTHIIIVASSSRYGDYFAGSKESIMWVDDLELLYE